jgi:hypothetical protein
MGTCIWTDKGYVPLAKIDLAKNNDDGTHDIVVDGKVVQTRYSNFAGTVFSLVPVTGDWLVLSEGENGREEIVTMEEPVLAWGLTVGGHLVPVTASESGGVQGDYRLRRADSDRLYGAGIGGYESSPQFGNSRSELVNGRVQRRTGDPATR